jgi:hypothetical protein
LEAKGAGGYAIDSCYDPNFTTVSKLIPVMQLQVFNLQYIFFSFLLKGVPLMGLW